MADRGGARLDVAVMGPLVVRVDGDEVEVGRHQVRRLLALLATLGEERLAADDAVEQLWPGDERPADPKAALRVVLSRTRAALGPAADRLAVGPDGIALGVDHSDLATAAGLVDRARAADDPAEAATLLDEALGCWRGRPFADVAGPPRLDEEARTIDELRWFARTRLVEARHELGEHDTVVALATPWVAAQPHRERLAVDLARSLAATGEKATALEVLATTRGHLRDELGVDPGEELVEAERAILTGAVQLTGRPTTAATTDAGTRTATVGRDEVVERLLTAEGTVLVRGEPGIGKSAVLAEVARRARAAGRPVVTATVEESLRHPLQPVATLVAALTGGEPTAVPSSLRPVLFPDQAPATGEPPPSRDTLIQGCTDLLVGVAAEGQLVIVDDVHLLDALSADVLAGVHHREAMTILLARRPGSGGALATVDAPVVDLGSLTVDDVLALLAQRVPRRARPEVAAALHARSGGNPLFTGLLVDAMAEGDSTDAGLPSTLLVAVARRLDDLRRRTVRTLEVAAVLGPTFPLPHLLGLRPDALDDLEEAADAHLVELDEAEGVGRFRHVLVLEAIDDLMAPARRVDLHDEAGRHLEAAGEPPTVYARHYEAAAAIDPTRAVVALTEAARRFAAASTWDVARALLEQADAVHRERRGADDGVIVAARVARGAVLQVTGDPTSAEVLLDAAVAAQGLRDDTLFAEAVIELSGHGRALTAGRVHGEAEALLDDALALDLTPDQRARLCANAAVLLSTSTEHERSRRLYLEAFAAARSLGRPDVEQAVVGVAHLGLDDPDDFDLRVEAADRLAALGPDDIDRQWEATFLRAGTAMVVGDGPLLWASLDRLRALTPLIVTRPRHFGLAFTEAAGALVVEDFPAVEAHLERVLEEGLARYPESWVMSVYSSVLLGLRKAEGRLGELAPAVAGLLADAPDFPTWHVIAAVAAVANDDGATARHHWGILRQNGLAGLVRDHTWTAAMGFAGELAVALDDDASARIAYDALLPHAGRMQWSGTCTYGPVDDVLAVLAGSFGDDGEAADRRVAADELRRRLQPA